MHFTRQRRPGNQRIKCPLGQPQMSVGGVMQYQPGRVPQGEYRLAVSWRRSAGDVIQEMAQPSPQTWKACWVQAIADSNPASTASSASL